MKPTITKADIGYRIIYENETYYIGAQTENGYCYKDQQAFENMNGVCYISEYQFFDEVGWDENIPDEIATICEKENISIWGIGMYDEQNECGYTYQDIIKAVRNWCSEPPEQGYSELVYDEFIEHIAQCVFENAEWASLETYLYELDINEEWDLFIEEYIDDKRLTPQQKKELGYE